MMSLVDNGERDIVLDQIIDDLGILQKTRERLVKNIFECFSINFMDEDNIYFDTKRSKSVLHFIVRKLLRIDLNCGESCKKYYGEDIECGRKIFSLIQAARSLEVFDERPPDISSKNHPTFNKLTPEGLHASQLYGALEALRKSVVRKHRIKQIAEVPSSQDNVTCSSSSSSNQLSSVLGKRPSSPVESLINADENKKIDHHPSAKDKVTRDLREDLDADESVEMARAATNVC
jgi:hypothetical protein